MRQVSEEGLRFVQDWEGTKLKAYRDSAGFLTIGTGHKLTLDELTSGKLLLFNGEPAHWREGLSKGQVVLLLDQDLDEVERVISRDRIALRITQEAFDALCSLAFNIGTGAYYRSTLRKKLLAGNLTGAKDEFKRWVWAGGRRVRGLIRRRRAEENLFWEGKYSAP